MVQHIDDVVNFQKLEKFPLSALSLSLSLLISGFRRFNFYWLYIFTNCRQKIQWRKKFLYPVFVNAKLQQRAQEKLNSVLLLFTLKIKFRFTEIIFLFKINILKKLIKNEQSFFSLWLEWIDL